MLRDITLALRAFRRKPGVPLIIVLSLGAAMGLSASLFSVVNATWFRPWNVDNAHELRVVGLDVTADEWASWPRHTRTFSGLAVRSSTAVARLGREVVRPRLVSANYFDVLGVRMAAGRTLRQDDGPDAAVISHLWWQRRFGGDPDVIGRTLFLNRVERDRPPVRLTVVGVADQTFSGVDVINEHVWFGLNGAGQFDVSAPRLTAFGRLREDVTDALARAELSVVARRYVERLPPEGVSLRTTDRYSLFPPPVETHVRWVSFVVGVVFIALVACANVANLLLARGHARRSEIALCMAIGGSRSAIVSQLLIESLLLSLAGAAVGVVIAAWLPDALFRPLEPLLDGRLAFPVDWRVLLWSLVIAVVSCGAFGLVPALRSTDLTLNEALKEGHDNAQRPLMPSLLAWQTIVAVMAMVIAGLMLRSGPVVEAWRTNAAMADVTVVRVDAEPRADRTQRAAFVDALFTRLRPRDGVGGIAGIEENQIFVGGTQSLHVTPDYFAALRIPFSSGRTFAPVDASGEVVVVNRAFADIHWRGRNAVGQLVPRSVRGHDSLAGRRVIGVVDNTPLASPTAFLPADAAALQTLFVRAPRGQVTAIGAAVVTALPSTATLEYVDGSEWATSVVGPALLVARMTSGFGLSALALGIVGFFSLLEYAVQQRTREIGIRRALGATSVDVVRSVVDPASRPMLRGLLLGAIGAAVTAMFMERAQLPSGIDPFDAVTYVAVIGVLVLTAGLAALVPVRRALRLEPMRALRVD